MAEQTGGVRVVRISTIGQLEHMTERYLRRGRPVFFDIETTGLNPRSNKIVSLIFKQEGHPVVVMDARDWYPSKRDKGVLGYLFGGELLIVGHNIKFDLEFIKQHTGVEIARLYDTMLAEKILDGGLADFKEFNLKAVAALYGIEVHKEERQWFVDLDKRDGWHLPFPADQVRYMAQDVEVLEPIYRAQLKKLRDRKLFPVAKLEFEAVLPIAAMELNGIAINEEKWGEFISRKEAEAEEAESECLKVFGPPILRQRIQEFEQQEEDYNYYVQVKEAYEVHLRYVWEQCGGQLQEDYGEGTETYKGWGDFKQARMKEWRERNPNPGKPKWIDTVNIGSNAQMMQAFKQLGIPAPSCKEEDLKLLEEDYPILKVYGRYKKKEKFVTSWNIDKVRAEYIDPVDGRIHTSFNQIIDTGRMSSSGPNLQQVPARGPDGKEMRSLIVARPGHKLVVNDYPGIEDRILCYLSGDPVKRRIFDEALDPHTETARLLFDLDGSVEVRSPNPAYGGKSYRDLAKELNYGLMYGLFPKRLAKKLNILVDTAEELHAKYKSIYKVTFDWLEAAQKSSVGDLVSYTILGRPRYYSLPEKPVWSASQVPAEYRKAVREYNLRVARVGRQGANARIQGTSADITKTALVLLHKRLPKAAMILLAVHDEIVVEAPDHLAQGCAAILEDSMEAACEMFMPGFPVPCKGAVISDYWRKE